MTCRKGGIFQQGSTNGGLHPGCTGNMPQQPAMEADLFNGLEQGGIDVHEVRCPAGGLSNIAYARIKPLGGADSKQALGIMPTGSEQGLPKVPIVFDTDVDIWDDQAVLAAMAYRAFDNLRHKLGRTNDPPWYRYALSDKPFAGEAKPQAFDHSDPRHLKTAG